MEMGQRLTAAETFFFADSASAASAAEGELPRKRRPSFALSEVRNRFFFLLFLFPSLADDTVLFSI